MKELFRFFIVIIIFVSGFSASAQIISTVAGNAYAGYSGDGGPATSASLNNPIGVAIDMAGNMYVSDFNNHRIRKIEKATGIISTIAGTGTAGFSGDGGPANSAQINNPGDICVDASGNVYFIDTENFRVRKIEASTGIISTIAGNGAANYNGETILAVNAGIHNLVGLAVDATGIYITLASNPRIVKVTLASGLLTTIAGTGTTVLREMEASLLVQLLVFWQAFLYLQMVIYMWRKITITRSEKLVQQEF